MIYQNQVLTREFTASWAKFSYMELTYIVQLSTGYSAYHAAMVQEPHGTGQA